MLLGFPREMVLCKHVAVIAETIDQPTTRVISAVAELLVTFDGVS